MTGDCHVRFCERLGGETPPCLLGEKISFYKKFKMANKRFTKSKRKKLTTFPSTFRKKQSNHGFTVGKSGDKYEQEADRMASYVMDETILQPSLSSNIKLDNKIQKQETKKEPTEGEKYKEALKKTGEAFIETPVGKRITDKAKELGEDFISTLPGKVITGAAAAGAITAIVAKNAELPIQPPSIPLNKITPGLSMNITYKGPVLKPTSGAITFAYKFGAGRKMGKGQGKSKREKIREETASKAYELREFRESMKTPEQKAADEDFMIRQIVNKTNDPLSPLFIPGLTPKKEAPNLSEQKKKEDVPVQRKETNSHNRTTGVPVVTHDVLRSSGQPLDSSTRKHMEGRFGHDFSKVRVHNDMKAAKSASILNAQAYTTGNNIVFGVGKFAQGTNGGNRLLAHELTHVVQQSRK